MRRGNKITKISLLFLVMAAFFNLVSFSLDQLVVQEEDKLRDLLRKKNDELSNIKNLVNIKNTVSSLVSNLNKEESLIYDTLDMNTRLISILNSKDHKFTKNLDQESIKELKEHFSNDLFRLIKSINYKSEKLNFLINSRINEDNIKKQFKEKDLSYIIDFLINVEIKRIPDSLIKDYKFEVATDEKAFIGDHNYQIYRKLYNLITNNFTVVQGLEEFFVVIDEIYENKFIKYLYTVDNYASIKNRNNYFILLSITSQILGVTFLLLLFRSLVGARVHE